MYFKAAASLLVVVLSIYSIEAIFSYKRCPLERPGNFDCRAAKFQYKCSGFMSGDDLIVTSYSPEKTKWIGGLPDALNNPKVQASPEIRATFGNLKKKNFQLKQETCNLPPAESFKVANARCYAAMQESSQIPMESCRKSIYNKDGDQIVGDLFCERISRGEWVAKNKRRIGPLTIGFQVSACKSDWAALDNRFNGTALTMNEQLCCRRRDENSVFRFIHCDRSKNPPKRDCN